MGHLLAALAIFAIGCGSADKPIDYDVQAAEKNAAQQSRGDDHHVCDGAYERGNYGYWEARETGVEWVVVCSVETPKEVGSSGEWGDRPTDEQLCVTIECIELQKRYESAN